MKQEMIAFANDVKEIFDEYIQFAFQMTSNGVFKEQDLTGVIEVKPNKKSESIEVILRSLYGGIIKGETRFFGQSYREQEVDGAVDEILFSIPFSDYYHIDHWQPVLIEDIEKYITNLTINVPIVTDKDISSFEPKKVYQARYIG
ncbi:hypothetical protein SAMN04487944_12134 [Gracilibacillus ureilyticus]|uniref:Uncharacterized protein n=1 Tax=Gracilibacillus ureilyticus TaxID=531814 RepID=A0A1H9V550_9BACI|nr:hypothetical protein [Gracilibacillus ureilyticus]SES16403.1 hypothetical protein SAMN04487944_12134 [Gracilibacillus ureilyticus]